MYLVDFLHQHGIGVILDWVRPTFLPMLTASLTSMARISTSTPTPVRDSS